MLSRDYPRLGEEKVDKGKRGGQKRKRAMEEQNGSEPPVKRPNDLEVLLAHNEVAKGEKNIPDGFLKVFLKRGYIKVYGRDKAISADFEAIASALSRAYDKDDNERYAKIASWYLTHATKKDGAFNVDPNRAARNDPLCLTTVWDNTQSLIIKHSINRVDSGLIFLSVSGSVNAWTYDIDCELGYGYFDSLTRITGEYRFETNSKHLI